MKERDELAEARRRIRELEAAVADAHIDHCLEKASFQVACDRLGKTLRNLKKQRYDAVRHAKAGEEAVKLPVVTLYERVGMSLQNDYKSRKVRERKKG